MHISIDDLPVPSPKKDFNDLLEEQLRDSTAINVESNNKHQTIIKRPFLKKGEGLARFMPNSNRNMKNVSRPRSASFSTGIQTRNPKAPKSSKTLERCNSMPRSRKSEPLKRTTISPASAPPLKMTSRNNISNLQKKLCSKTTGSKLSSINIGKKKTTEGVSDVSSDLDVKNKRELEEVRIFELLEDKAENSSFCSTSSTVIAFLQQSTPLKHKALLHGASKHEISFNDIGDQTLEKIIRASNLNQRPLQKVQHNIQKKISSDKIPHQDVDFEIHSDVICSTKLNQNSISQPKTGVNKKLSQWTSVPASTLKKNIVSSSISSYRDEIDEQYEDDVSNQELNHDENGSLHVRFSEYNEYKTMTDSSSVSSDSQTIISFMNDKGAWSDCSVTPDSSDVESVLSMQSKSDSESLDGRKASYSKRDNIVSDDETKDFRDEEDDEDEDELEKKNVTLQKDDTIIDERNQSTSFFKSELLKTRLLELEHEIDIFRKESAALTLQRQKLQEERNKLQEDRINLQRSVREREEALETEKKKTESILLEEKKRLAREKTALESRMKDAYEKAQKNKQERQEIQCLRDQLEELKEELSQKESKWSATNARQRSQMRVLQTENSKLKQELEKMQQKKNNKFKKPVTSNTRAIHQINKFLADRRKISPFKDDDIEENEIKTSNTARTSTNIGQKENLADNCLLDKEVEKVKILRTTESITRTRNLYESLLRDATEDFREQTISGTKNDVNHRRSEILDQARENESNEQENNYDDHHAVDVQFQDTSESPKLSHEELQTHNDSVNIEFDQPKSDTNKKRIREVHHPDGRIEYFYPNGNVKKVFPDTNIVKMIYYNGDVRETDENGNIRYYYAATRTWHITMPDGLEILEFPDGQVERRSQDGTVEVTFSDGSVRIVQSDGSEKWALRDGTIAETSADGEKVLTLPNGQREIHTKDHKRREYPDGTVKLVYPDGVQETRYANGRVRLKDKDGNLIMDSHQ